MGKKRLFINLIANLASFSVSIGISFLLTPFLVGHLGKDVYGFYSLANNVVNYIAIISIALNSMFAKYITVALVQKNIIKARQYYTSIFFSNIILSLALIPILTLFVIFVQHIFNIPQIYLYEVRLLFLLVFCTMLLSIISSVFGASTYATNRIDLAAYVNMGKTFLRIIAYVLIFKVFRPSIVYIGVVVLLLEGYNSIAQIILKNKLLPQLCLKRIYFNIKLIVDVLKVGVWNSLSHFGDLMLSSSDLLVANILLGPAAAGVIAIIKTMPSLVSGIITATNAVFMPRIATRYGENNKELLVQEVNMSQRIMGTFTIPLVMTLIIFGKDFFNLWVPGNDSTLLAQLATIDLPRMMIVGVVWPVANLNIVIDKIKIPSILVIISGILNILFMFICIHFTPLGIYSIPLTTLILSILFYAFFIPIYPCKALKISKTAFLKPIAEMIISIIVIALITIPFKHIVNITDWYSFILFGGISGLVSLIIAALIFLKLRNIYSWILLIAEKIKSIKDLFK